MTNSAQIRSTPSNTRSVWPALACALLALAAIFVWIYARSAGSLYFGMDDYIETEAALAKPLVATISDFFSGQMSWSGYRPVAYSVRAALAHLLGTEQLTGYYLFSLGIHFVNTLLLVHLIWRVARWVLPAFIGALFFLLVPSHNEAVLYMSANANILALFLALLSLEATITFPLADRKNNPLSSVAKWLLVVAAAVAYLLAILAYEVTLPVILLFALADWGISTSPTLRFGEWLRRRTALYLALAIAAAIALALRAWAGGGVMGPARADYGTSFALDHLLRGYTILFSQIALLYNSPWLHLPDFVYTREWMAPTNPRAIASIALTVGAVCTVFWLALRTASPRIAARRALLWIGWGLLWVLLVALPFAALAGRNPENRYTYIPSFGVAVAVAALIAWLFSLLAEKSWRRAGQIVLTLLVAGWMGFYAWVTTSDVAEFGRAGAHARAFLAAVDTLPIGDAASISQATSLATVGIPGDTGSAYVFTTDEALESALRLHGANPEAALLAGDLALAGLPLDLPDATESTLLLGYDRIAHAAQPIEIALFCSDLSLPDACQIAQFAPAGSSEPTWLYLQLYDELAPATLGYGMLVDASTSAPTLRSCWQFADLTQVQIDPASFEDGATQQACNEAFAALTPAITSAIAAEGAP